jgi:hypothetical protein
MTMKKTATGAGEFFADYQHPKWQKKRLQIMEQDGFRCRRCKREDANLHVHHISYASGKKPWEYPDSNFACLCHSCHHEIHHIISGVKDQQKRLVENWCTMSSDFDLQDLLNLFTMMVCLGEEGLRVFTQIARLLQSKGGE